MPNNSVNRFSTFNRLLHWLVAVSFFLLVFSGAGFFSPLFFGFFDLFGGPQQGMVFHKWSGVIFFIGSILLFLSHAGDTCRFDGDDCAWISKLGGYLSRHSQEVPQGKFNAGQKLFAVFTIIATLVMGGTGWIIWDPMVYGRELTQVSLMLHGLFFGLFMIGMVVHIYLGTLGNPGTVEGMLWGQVSKKWAKKHALKWYQKMVKE